MAEETKRGSKGGEARALKLSKEERSAIAKAAAQKRWKGKKEAATGEEKPTGISSVELGPATVAQVEKVIHAKLDAAVQEPETPPAPDSPVVLPVKPVRRTKPMPKAFKGASSYAEKRLVEALKERGECMGRLGALNAEIPSLIQVIRALGGTAIPTEALQNFPPSSMYPSPDTPYMQPHPGAWTGTGQVPQMPPPPNIDPGLFQANGGPVPGTPALSPIQLIPKTSAGGAMDLDYVPVEEDEGHKLPNLGGGWV